MPMPIPMVCPTGAKASILVGVRFPKIFGNTGGGPERGSLPNDNS